jgi:hypothetical protein
MKLKKCKVCKESFEPRQFAQICCGYKCAIIHAKELKRLKDTREWNAEKKVLKEKLKTLGQYEAEAKKSFQKWIRLRDKDKPCISCGKLTDEMDGGHFKKAEIYSGVIFNEMNCHSQCRKCNRFQNGNELNYRLGLINRYSLSYADKIEQLANETRQHKYTKADLIAKKIQYDLRYKEDLKC